MVADTTRQSMILNEIPLHCLLAKSKAQVMGLHRWFHLCIRADKETFLFSAKREKEKERERRRRILNIFLFSGM
jgi:hypothetical protein